MKNKIYLASQSPRRGELLQQINIEYKIIKLDVDERVLDSESPAQYTQRLAMAKAKQGWLINNQKGEPVLGADTCIAFQGEILGKPRDREHALDMLQRLSGNTHDVYTAVAVVGHNASGEYLENSLLNRSQVEFRQTTLKEREWYWNTGEPMDKAGAYAIQGLGAVFISKIEGSYSGIMGLPLFEVSELLRQFGVTPAGGQANAYEK